MLGIIQLRRYTLSVFLLLFFVFCFAMIGTAPRKAFADTQCKIILSIDRSGSISDSQWQQMGVQVQNLLKTGVTGVPNLYIAMWTFSHGDPAGDYNAPHGTDYIQAGTIAGNLTLPGQQNAIINTIFFGTNATSAPIFGPTHPPYLVRDGGTDYQQAFGYSSDPNNGGAATVNPSVRSIVNGSPDGFVLITDGAPNYPGGVDGNSGLDNNNAALSAGRAARGSAAYTAIPAYGAYVTEPSAPAPDLTGLNYTILKNSTDSVGPVNFGNVEGFIRDKIADACATVPPAIYSLTPSVNPSFGQGGGVITDGSQPQFDYTVNNDGDTTNTDWQIYDIQIDPGVPIPVPQCFNSSCDLNTANVCAYLSSITCTPSQDDNNATPNSGTNRQVVKPSITLYTNRTANVKDLSSLKPGTRVCRGLRISNPTQTGIPPYRLSIYCFVYAKAPLLQIHGGDIRVGRPFQGDTVSYQSSGIYTTGYTLRGTDKPNGLTFGSWVEYGALAPGPIMNLASLAGYRGGAEPPVDACGASSSRSTNYLTFANYNTISSECGRFADSIGTIPDVVAPITSWPVINGSISSPFQLKPDSSAGRYVSLSSSGVTVSASTIPTVGTFIISVPNGTVTIDGDITYGAPPSSGKYRVDQLKDIPQVIIIAQNIAIKGNVTRVDAWLVANGTGNKQGIISTCSDIKANNPKACEKQLTINGPVMARELQPWRTTVYTGSCKLEGNYLTSGGCVGSTTNPVDKPGEIFNLPGSSILWAINQTDLSRAQTTYTIELPPYY